jgi:hypothetical protein
MPKFAIVLLLLTAGDASYSAQFQNLGFDAASTNNLSGTPGHAPTTEMLPGWQLETPEGETATVGYNFFPTGLNLAILYDASMPQPPQFPIEVKYSLGLWPESGKPFSLIQSGEVPLDAKTIRFLNFGGQFELRANDILVPLTYVYPAGYFPGQADQRIDAFGNIASLAGQNVELKFTTIQGTVGPFVNGIDSIVFSPENIPEPGTWELLGLGGLIFFGAGKFSKREVTSKKLPMGRFDA